MSDNNVVYTLSRIVTTTGSLGIGNISNEGKIRFVISNAGVSNLVRVRARIVGQTAWTNLIDFTGDTNDTVDVFTWDQIEVLVLVYSSASTYVRIAASSFDGSGVSVSTPDGDVDNINTIIFTSSDNSVTITGDQDTGTIDFVAVGGGGSSDYIDTFNATSDWTGPTLGIYSLVYDFSTHAKTSPVIDLFETISSNNEPVIADISVDSSNNVTISVSESPDLRFIGKIIIS